MFSRLLSVTLIVVLTPSVFAVSFDELASRIPADANMLLMLDAKHVFDSELARMEHWKEASSTDFAATPLLLPESAGKVLIGAALDFETMHPHWEVASMEMLSPFDADSVQQKVGGLKDEIGGVDVVWPHKGLCMAAFSSTEVAAFAPTNRSAAAGWIRRSRQADVQRHHSPYLLHAMHYARRGGPQIIMTMDASHLLHRNELSSIVQQSELFDGVDRQSVEELLAGLKGVVLGIKVTDRLHGKLIVDFSSDAKPINEIAKPIVTQAITTLGASFDELSEWKVETHGTRVSLSGDLSSESLLQLLSLISLDARVVTPSEPPHLSSNKTSRPAANDKNSVARASKHYFHSLDSYLRNVHRSASKRHGLKGVALFVNNFARRIDRLPTSHVDEELVQFGRHVADEMREAVAEVHGIERQGRSELSHVQDHTRVGVTAVPTFRTVNYGGHRMRRYAPMAFARVDLGATRKRNQIVRETASKETAAANQRIHRIHSEMNSLRKRLSDRYGVKF